MSNNFKCSLFITLLEEIVLKYDSHQPPSLIKSQEMPHDFTLTPTLTKILVLLLFPIVESKNHQQEKPHKALGDGTD